MAGVFIYQACAIHLGRLLAPLSLSLLKNTQGHIPSGYVLLLGNIVIWALPVAIAVFLLIVVALRLFRPPLRPIATALAIGMFASYLYPNILAAVIASDSTPWVPWVQIAKFLFVPIWWLWPVVVAPWLGLFLAYRVSSARSLNREHREV